MRGRPAMQLVECYIDVCFETTIMVDQIAMTALSASHLDRQDILGRAIELVERERVDEALDIAGGERDHDIHIVGQARLAIEDPRHAACHEVRDAEAFESDDEWLELARFPHAGRSFGRARRSRPRSTSGGGGALALRAAARRPRRPARPAVAVPRASWHDIVLFVPVMADPRRRG